MAAQRERPPPSLCDCSPPPSPTFDLEELTNTRVLRQLLKERFGPDFLGFFTVSQHGGVDHDQPLDPAEEGFRV